MVHLSATSNVFTSLWSKQEGIVLLLQKIARFFYIYLSLQNKQYRMCIRCVFSYGKKKYIHNNIYTKNIYNVYTHPHIHAYVYSVCILYMSESDELYCPGMFICYSDRSSTVQQNDSNRSGHRQQKSNILHRQCTKWQEHNLQYRQLCVRSDMCKFEMKNKCVVNK